MMAKLPPRAPTMAAQDLLCSIFQPLDSASWIHDDDFVDFCAGKRKAHRQTVNGGNASTSRVKRSPSPEVKIEHHEAESATCPTEEGTTTVSPAATEAQQTVSDPKRVKRIVANRQSARRSRVRKLQYISELERSLTTLQTEVAMLSPRVAYLDHQRIILSDENSLLKTKIAALAHHNLFKDAHEEALKREIERLNQVHKKQQQQHNINNQAAATATPASSPP